MNKYLAVIIILTLISNSVYAQTSSKMKKIDTKSYKLQIIDNKPYLNISHLNKKIEIPTEWLIVNKKTPPIKSKAKISLNHYEQKITAFTIDKQNQFIGLHLSSYVIHNSGSGSKSGIAYGKDVFLIHERETNKLFQSQINLGLSKERKNTNGCFSAKFTHFYLQDLQRHDQNFDIGVQIEEVKCTEYKQGNKIVKRHPRYYNLAPIKWYKFNKNIPNWKYVEELSPKIKADNIIGRTGIWNLPIICLLVTPVEYVKYTYKSRYSNFRKKDSGCKYNYIEPPLIE